MKPFKELSRKKIVLVLCSTILIFILSACSSEKTPENNLLPPIQEDAIIGEWVYSEDTLVYHFDGEGNFFYVGESSLSAHLDKMGKTPYFEELGIATDFMPMKDAIHWITVEFTITRMVVDIPRYL